MNQTTSHSDPRNSCLPLFLPQGFCYSCHSSGVCCRSFPKIVLDEPTEQRLRSLDFSRLGLDDLSLTCAEHAITTEEGSAHEPILRHRTCDGACVFLDAGQLCALHRNLGEEAKPRVCREFPFFYRQAPDGIYLGLSFVCPSVRRNAGTPLAEQRQQLQTRALDAFGRTALAEPVLLNSRFRLVWQEYQDLESSLLEILALEDFPLSQRLIALNLLVNFVDVYARKLYNDQPLVGEARDIPGNSLAEFLGALRRSGYRDLMRVAAKQAVSPALQRMFLGMITSFRSSVRQRQGRARVLFGILGQYLRHLSGVGGLRLAPFASRVPYRQLGACRFPEQGEASELLRRYIEHCIFRKDLLWKTDLTRGVNILLLNAALVRWYAAASAAERQSSAAEAEDFSEAVAQVERFFGCHSEFYQLFTQHSALNEVIEAFMLRKNYPFVLLGQ